MKLQVVAESEIDDQDISNHESNGIALHEPPEDAEPAVDESEPEPALPPESELESDQPATPSAIDPPATEQPTDSPPESGDISTDEMPDVSASPAVEEPAGDASHVGNGTSLWESHVNSIRDQEREIASAEISVNSAKEYLKEEKAKFDAAVAELRSIIRRGPDQPSLFGSPVQSTPIVNGDPVITSDPPPVPSDDDDSESNESTTATASAIDDDSWKSTPIVELEIVGLSKAIITKLLDAGINTVGELADWTTEYRTLADVKGLGPKKVEAVESAMERFWAERSNAKEDKAS